MNQIQIFLNGIPKLNLHQISSIIILFDKIMKFSGTNYQRVLNNPNWNVLLTLRGGNPSDVPEQGLIITRAATKSDTTFKELHRFRTISMAVYRLCTAPNGRSSCKSRLLKAQPPCHH